MGNERIDDFALNEEELAHASGGAANSVTLMRVTCTACGWNTIVPISETGRIINAPCPECASLLLKRVDHA